MKGSNRKSTKARDFTNKNWKYKFTTLQLYKITNFTLHFSNLQFVRGRKIHNFLQSSTQKQISILQIQPAKQLSFNLFALHCMFFPFPSSLSSSSLSIFSPLPSISLFILPLRPFPLFSPYLLPPLYPFSSPYLSSVSIPSLCSMYLRFYNRYQACENTTFFNATTNQTDILPKKIKPCLNIPIFDLSSRLSLCCFI